MGGGGAGVKEEEKKSFRIAVKEAEREAKKSKLNIIHPLDYNQTGVEVIFSDTFQSRKMALLSASLLIYLYYRRKTRKCYKAMH